MTNDDLQLGKAVEHPAEHHADDMKSGVDVPAPAGRRKNPVHCRRKAAVQRIDDRLRWNRRMQIDRDVERFSALDDRPEELVIQIPAA